MASEPGFLRHNRHNRHAVFDGPLVVTYMCDGNHARVMELTAMNVSDCSTPGAEPRAPQFAVSLRAECKRVRESLAANEARCERAEAELDEQVQRLLEILETQQSEAAARVGELETRREESGGRAADGETAAEDGGVNDDFRRRYELALDDLRELKAKNGELQQQVTRLRASNTSNIVSGRPVSGGLNWEAEKARILAVLEADTEDTAERHSERLTIEDVIRATDQVIAAKDRQIEELEKHLADATTSGGASAGDATRDAILDRDEIILEERSKLQRVQQEWREKLRQAEIELSLERATIARERAELESRSRAAPSQPQSVQPTAATLPPKPARGRWLTRLGLADTEPPKERSEERPDRT
jgi:hypothetical protein